MTFEILLHGLMMAGYNIDVKNDSAGMNTTVVGDKSTVGTTVWLILCVKKLCWLLAIIIVIIML